MSLVFLQSEKGRTLFNKVIDDIKYRKVNLENVVKYNPSMTKSAGEPKDRGKVIDVLNKKGFKEGYRTYLRIRNYNDKINTLKAYINKLFN